MWSHGMWTRRFKRVASNTIKNPQGGSLARNEKPKAMQRKAMKVFIYSCERFALRSGLELAANQAGGSSGFSLAKEQTDFKMCLPLFYGEAGGKLFSCLLVSLP